jgi:hypothetical protein
MTKDDQDLMSYVDDEVRAVCEARGWGHQIRRKWSVREKPVSASPIEDYEWKLLPHERGRLPDTSDADPDGSYYVLSVCRGTAVAFVLQHDTTNAGLIGPHWERETSTTITPLQGEGFGLRFGQPGWLRDHLLELVAKFGPNEFCRT